MIYFDRSRFGFGRSNKGRSHSKSSGWCLDDRERDQGFTLIELLIVTAVLPLIIGAISLGLIAIFSMQSGVASRINHSADAHVVAVNYQKDVASAAEVTTSGAATPLCGVSNGQKVSIEGTSNWTLLLGLESDLDTQGDFLTSISYIEVPITSGTSTTYSLLRLYCANGTHDPTAEPSIPNSTSILAYDLTNNQLSPNVTCVSGVTIAECSAVSSQWFDAKNVSQVTFTVNDPKNNFPYTLVASPVASQPSTIAGSPVTTLTSTSCGFASPGSGTYASTMCFVNFAPVTGAALTAAESGGCLELSVSLPNNYTMFFCLSLSGGQVLQWYLPTWPEAFLGNSIGGTPFYTGIPGDPALYQRVEGSAPSIITLSNIAVVSPTGVLASGWQMVSADAESTDVGESITWTANSNLFVIPNGEPGQTQPVGNACQNGSALTGSGTETVECSGGSTETSATKTGTAMVYAAQPTQMSVTMVGTGLEAVSFGMLLP